jgi:hypothetical protein
VGERVLSVREAAELLGVSPQRVRQMLLAGDLSGRRSSAGWMVEERQVRSRLGDTSVGRPHAAVTAWAAIGLLAAAGAAPADGVRCWAETIDDRRVRHRVRRLLAELPDPVDVPEPWRRLLAARGRVRRFWGHPGVLDRLAVDPRVSPSGDASMVQTGDGLTGGGRRLDLYVAAVDVEDLVRRYLLRDDFDGQVSLVVVPAGVPAGLAPEAGRHVPEPAAVGDLLDEHDPRARDAALHRLRALRQLARDGGWIGVPTATGSPRAPAVPARPRVEEDW